MGNDRIKGELKGEIKRRVRSFWDTREGTVGMIVGAGVLGGLGWAAYRLMPYIASLLENTVTAVIFGLVLVALIWVFVIDGTLRNRLWLAYQLLMKAVTYSIFEYDPAGTMRILSQQVEKMLEEARAAVRLAAGRVQNIKQTLDDLKDKQARLTAEAQSMIRKQRPQEDIESHARMLGETAATIERLSKVYERFAAEYDNLTKAETALVRMHREAENAIELRVKEYEAANGLADAWRAFGRVFSRTTSVNQLRDMLIEYMNDDFANKMGEIGTYVQDSAKVIKQMEIRDDVATERGLQMLAALDARKLDFNDTPSLSAPGNGPRDDGEGGIDYSRFRH